MKKLTFVMAILVIAALLLSACGKTTTPTATSTATSPTTTQTAAPKNGGTLRIIYQYSPTTTPGWPGETTNAQKLWLNWIVFEALVKLDSGGFPTPWLATDWTWGPNNTYIDFNLRQDVKFHDGTQFTAESVVTHVNQLFTDKNSSTVDWDRIEKTGDYSVRLYLKTYKRNFWGNLANWAMVYTSDTALKANGVDYMKQNPIGTGPFKFVSFEKDVSMVFAKNPDYWQTGKPYLDGITFYTTKESLTQQAKMQAHEGDVLTLQADGKVLDDMKSAGFDVITQTGSSNIILFDTANQGAVTNDPRVRMAIEYAMNKQEIADTMGHGYMKPNNQIPFTGNPAFNFNLGSRDYDPDKAKQLLTEAGYPNGLTIHLIAETRTQDFAVLLQGYLAEVGITLEMELVDNAKFFDYLRTGWNGIIATGYAMGTNLPNFLLTYFPPLGTLDVSVKIPDDIVAKANAAMVEPDDAKFKQMSDELSQWIFDEAFIVATVGVAMGYIIDPAVMDHGFLTEFVDFSVWSPELCWLNR